MGALSMIILGLYITIHVVSTTFNVNADRCAECSSKPVLGTLNEFDCSNCNLQHVPTFFSSTTKIYLSFNNISIIRSTTFHGMIHLQELYFGHNMLSSIEKNSLSTLQSLRVLVLYDNILDCTSLQEIRSLSNLTHLDIRKNIYKTYPRSIIFLLKLNVLKVDVFQRFHFNVSFLSLKKITEFNINTRGMITLQNESFEGLRNSPIKELKIVPGEMVERKIGKDFLSPFRFLKRLTIDIGGNYDIKDVMSALYGLRNRTLDFIDAHGNNWYIYRYHHLTVKDVAYLLTLCVKEINLEHNSIYYFPFLESLNSIFSNCLEKLIISKNNFIWTSSQIYGLMYLPSLKYIDISTDYQNSKEHFSIYTLPEKHNFHFNLTLHAFRSLEYLDISGIIMAGEITKSYSLRLDFPRLKIFKAAYTSLAICSFDVTFKSSLVMLDMSGWNCVDMHPGFIQRHRNLTFLNSSMSHIGKSINSGRLNSMLHGLIMLETVDLSYNSINLLHRNFFTSQHHSIKYINFRNNYFKVIPEGISSLERVHEIDFSYNNFAFFNKHDMAILEKMKNTLFNFDGNKFECTCLHIESLVWINQSKNIMQNMKCRDGTNMSQILKDINKFQLKCLSDFWLDFAVTSLLLLLLIILVAAFGYRNKSFIIYIFIKARRLVKNINRESKKLEYKYDVFVSYSQLDYDWVTGPFFRYLSNELCLEVCIHQKDFLPGEPIAEEILRCVESSKKSVFVITKNFLASRWSLFEMEIARHHVLQHDNDNLIVILKDDISVNEMPEKLKKIWWRIVCLKYPVSGNVFELDIFNKKLFDIFKKY